MLTLKSGRTSAIKNAFKRDAHVQHIQEFDFG